MFVNTFVDIFFFYCVFILAQVLSANIEEGGFTAASHQSTVQIFWRHSFYLFI